MSKRLELLVKTGELAGSRFTVPEGGLRLGRSSSNDVHLADEELSRSHCLFEQDGASGIRVLDLASANGTYVNGEALDASARSLNIGDVIEVGSSVLEVVGEKEPAPAPVSPTAASPSPKKAEGPIDLGLGTAKAEESSSGASLDVPSSETPASRSKVVNLICAGAVAVLIAAIVLLLTNGDLADKLLGTQKSAIEAQKPAIGMAVQLPSSFTYERIDANPQKIVRYQLQVVGDTLALTYDAQTASQADSQKVEEQGRLSDWSKKRLNEVFDSADWLGLESVTGPNATSSNALKSWRLKLIRNGQVKEVLVENTTLPNEFRTICETVETLANNDLGVQLSLRTPEECLASSKKQEEIGDELLEKWEIKDDNMWEGIKSLKRARNELKGLSAFYEDQNRLQAKIEAAEAKLKARYDSVYGQGERARQIEDWANALVAYREIRAMIPDTTDQRGADAEAKIRDIEGRLEDSKRKGKR